MTPGSHTFPRQRRIRKRKDFLACYAHGEKYHSAHFVLYALISPGQASGVGLTVSRKVGNAVTRNRLKRVLREFFRLQPDAFPGLRVVAVAKKDAGALNLNEAKRELAPLLRRVEKARSQKSSGIGHVHSGA